LPVPAGQALLADEAKARRSPINGTVVRPGQRVQVAGVLLALEAMTMETTIGDAVRAGAVLVAFA
jgi:biotin carboxyl carrier protein